MKLRCEAVPSDETRGARGAAAGDGSTRRRSLTGTALTSLVCLASSLVVLAVLARAQAPASSGAAHPPPAGGDGPCPQPVLKQRAIVSGIETDQGKLNNNVRKGKKVVHQKSGYSFKTIEANGRHLFTTPFTEADGAGEGKRFTNGEGPLGPREEKYNSNLRLIQGKLRLPDSDFPKLLDVFQPPFAHVDSFGKVRFAILRLNGLDSQSCFECHNSIGSGHPAGDGPDVALDRKPGTTGGPAGQASNAFINDTFPNPMMKFVRNPPHAFGMGYVEGLAEEITVDLIARKAALYAASTLKENRDKELETEMVVRDHEDNVLVRFGKLKVRYIGDPMKTWTSEEIFKALLGDADVDLSKDFKEIDDELEGVSRDLVVRPFQWKGIASNQRNFVRSAMNFHFGMMPRELNPNYLEPQEDHDMDKDGVKDEVTEGNVSALTIFTMAIRPPTQQVPKGKKAIVERGRKLFSGEKVDDHTIVIGATNSCASCHRPQLPLYNPKVCVRDPRDDVRPEEGETSRLSDVTTLVARQRSSRQLPIYKRLRAEFKRGRDARRELPDLDKMKLQDKPPKAQIEALREAFRAAMEPVGCPSSGYEFDLNMTTGSDFEALSFSYPRLPSTTLKGDKSVIQVPLFSDLKRHDMGEGLADKFDQPTDVDAITVARRDFLTRPLWGVADTGPWLHDGRARTLRDAILMHESLGSEANPAIEQFETLSCDDQAAIVEFLLTLRLSIDCRYEPCFDKPAECRPEPAKETSRRK